LVLVRGGRAADERDERATSHSITPVGKGEKRAWDGDPECLRIIAAARLLDQFCPYGQIQNQTTRYSNQY
jgi:hypothetical protein